MSTDSVEISYYFPPMKIFLWAEYGLVGEKSQESRIYGEGTRAPGKKSSHCQHNENGRVAGYFPGSPRILKRSSHFKSFPPHCCCSLSLSQKLFKYPFSVQRELGTLTGGTKNFKYRIKHSFCLFAKLIKAMIGFHSGQRGAGIGQKPLP